VRNISLPVLAAIGFLSAPDSRAANSELESDLASVLTEEDLTGVAWALLGEDGEESLGAIGLRDKLNESEFTLDTRFHVGSLAKSVLATGILRLATEGTVELDAPVSRYLLNLKFENPWKDVAVVSVRHLLDHTAGLNDAHLWQVFSERPAPETALIAAFPQPELQLLVRSRPGTRFSYSNMGYALLGMIVESVTGNGYEEYLDEKVLAPLKMYDSTFAFTTQEGERADPTLAWGHVDDGSRYAARPMFLRPAGQFTSTAADMARFLKFLLSDGVIDGKPFIDKAFMRARGRPSGTEAAFSGLLAGYALGLGRRDRNGVVGHCHSGSIIGFFARLCIFPNEYKAYAYSVNTDSEVADYERIDELLINTLGIAAAVRPQTAEPAADIAEWHGRYIFSPNRFRAFEYLDNVFGAVKISADGNSLLMESLQNSPRQLRPIGGRTYSANDRATQSHTFLRGEGDSYLLSDGFKTYEKVPTAYLASLWLSICLGVAGLAWLFLAGTVSMIRFRTKMLRLPEAPAFISIVLLFVPVPFFMTQSFMALGDATAASVLLAAVTLLLPVGMLFTIVRATNALNESRVNLAHGLAAAFALQWCVVLIAAGMLPLRLWA